jgi:GT2 family glycosyltransferase
MKDLAVIIVSYNTRDLLRTCLRSLLVSLERVSPPGRAMEVNQTVAGSGAGPSRGFQAGAAAPTYDVFVVDNGSPDGSPEMVAEEFPEIHLLALGENRGFAAANNRAIREADARYLLFLNPDTEVLGDAPIALLRFMDEHPAAGAAGGRLLNPDLSFQHSCFRFPTLPMSFLDFFPLNHRLANSSVNGRYPRARYRRAFRIDHPLGACLMVRREVVERIGGFDEGYFMYCEEVDWCYRMRQAGWEIWYTPSAEIIHHAGSSTRQSAGPMLVQLHRSRDRFFRRHYGPVFSYLAQRVVRLGMAAAERRARRAAARGELDVDELARRVGAYREVARGWPA